MKIDWFDSEKYFFTDESVKRQITDSISENLTDSDLESKEIKKPLIEVPGTSLSRLEDVQNSCAPCDLWNIQLN